MILRIPDKFQKPISRLSMDDRAWLFDALMTSTLTGERQKIDSSVGDLYDLIIIESENMERKANGKKPKDDIQAIAPMVQPMVQENETYGEHNRIGYDRIGKDKILSSEAEEKIGLLINYWNENIPRGIKCNGNTPDLQDEWKKIRKRYKDHESYSEAMTYAIGAYVKNIKSRGQDSGTYYDHRFSLYDFLKQKNGFINFLNK